MRILSDLIVTVARKTGLSSIPVAEARFNEFSDDEEDEAAELMRELEKIKRERQEQKEKEVSRLIGLELAAFSLMKYRNGNGKPKNKSSANMISHAEIRC